MRGIKCINDSQLYYLYLAPPSLLFGEGRRRSGFFYFTKRQRGKSIFGNERIASSPLPRGSNVEILLRTYHPNQYTENNIKIQNIVMSRILLPSKHTWRSRNESECLDRAFFFVLNNENETIRRVMLSGVVYFVLFVFKLSN
jgi:hypothetical protein